METSSCHTLERSLPGWNVLWHLLASKSGCPEPVPPFWAGTYQAWPSPVGPVQSYLGLSWLLPQVKVKLRYGGDLWVRNLLMQDGSSANGKKQRQSLSLSFLLCFPLSIFILARATKAHWWKTSRLLIVQFNQKENHRWYRNYVLMKGKMANNHTTKR